MSVQPERVRNLTPDRPASAQGPVVYWINRERRTRDNWALLYAQEQARERNTHVEAVFCLVPTFLDAALRQYDFMIKGLEELEQEFLALNIPFTLLLGAPPEVLVPWIHDRRPSLLVTDFEPLRIKQQWLNAVVANSSIHVHQVDAHNIVPCWHASPKQEFGAYTLRPKLKKLLPQFLVEYPEVLQQDASHVAGRAAINWDHVRSTLRVNTSISPVSWIVPGQRASEQALAEFVGRIETYRDRNDPTKVGQSRLSPYFHFGQLAPQRAALEALRIGSTGAEDDPVDAFLEELIVRRELSDNFTYNNENYDSFQGLANWAQQTLNDHRNDPRDYIYVLEQWEQATTHDELWNAAQRELATTGRLHGYMRMYWAKKLLEWSSTPEEALAYGIYLNDAYALDGRDPNGYVGVAWSIGGVHDRAWFERPVYGKIRYMNANGCARKFDVKTYIRTYAHNTLFL